MMEKNHPLIYCLCFSYFAVLLLCGRSLAITRGKFYGDGPGARILLEVNDVSVSASVPSHLGQFPFFGVNYSNFSVS